jgi:DNA (cytosine-5)-methyltransferase 1
MPRNVFKMRVLDLFSGIGGFSLGLERAGFETVAFCEIDKKAQMVLRKHWPNVPIFDDVSKLSAEALHDRGISVDVICGGFPCQDISVAGKGAGIEGERSGLWSEFARLIGELRPRYAIVENVSALLGRGLDRVLGDLAEIGYDAEWHCIPASAVGAPHRRDRIWILAYPSIDEGRSLAVGGSSLDAGAKGGNIRGVSAAYRRNQPKPEAEILAYASVLQQYGGDTDSQIGSPQASEFRNNGGANNVSNARRIAPEIPIARELSSIQIAYGSGWWETEPDVGRVAHGISGRVDRLKQLGNAVVPQIPELIGRAIMSC